MVASIIMWSRCIILGATLFLWGAGRISLRAVEANSLQDDPAKLAEVCQRSLANVAGYNRLLAEGRHAAYSLQCCPCVHKT